MSPVIHRNAALEMTREARSYDLLLRFSYLQVLDILTTIAFLSHGILEANPLVQFSMNAMGSQAAGLVAVKLCALGLGVYCHFTDRVWLLRRATWFFSGLVVWNLIALILGSVK
jgi:hypothetical protein